MNTGRTWVIDAYGCLPSVLQSTEAVATIFEAAVREMGLRPVAPAVWHKFPQPGGVTGFLVLAESHLSCHTFPERGFAAFDLYCCREAAPFNWEEHLRDQLGATHVHVRQMRRGENLS